MDLSRAALAGLIVLVMADPGAAAPPRADEVARAAAPMAAWAEDPLAVDAQGPATCAALAELRRRAPLGPNAPSGGGRALSLLTSSCSAYRRALASFPLDRLRWELYWHESLKEGAMVASEYWRDETVASERRLDALRAGWREAARAAATAHGEGCAALARAGLRRDGPSRACT